MDKFIVRVSKRARLELEESGEESHVSKVSSKSDITSVNSNPDSHNLPNILIDKNQNLTGMYSLLDSPYELIYYSVSVYVL